MPRVRRRGIRKHDTGARTPKTDRLWRALRGILIVGVLAIPLVISPSGDDTFRAPKEYLFRAEGILCALCFALLILRNGVDRSVLRWRDPALAIPVAALGWCVITTIASTNRLLSVASLGWVAAATVIFIATYLTGRRAGMTIIWIALIPAVINAVMYILQELRLWNPLGLDITVRAYRSALVGNPSDVGAFLVPSCLAAAALAVSTRHRLPAIAVAALLGVGVIATQTITAIAALTCGLLALLLTRSWRTAAAGAAVVLVGLAATVIWYPPLRQRVAQAFHYASSGDYNYFLSGRLTAFFAAGEMIRDHPIVGVGPGCYGWQYLPYSLRAESTHRRLLASSYRGMNFGEAHNDHLQTAAVAGVPAYLIFLSAVAVLCAASWRQRAASGDRGKFARVLAFPLGVSFFILAIAQFPLELAASLLSLIHYAGTALAWREL